MSFFVLKPYKCDGGKIKQFIFIKFKFILSLLKYHRVTWI